MIPAGQVMLDMHAATNRQRNRCAFCEAVHEKCPKAKASPARAERGQLGPDALGCLPGWLGGHLRRYQGIYLGMHMCLCVPRHLCCVVHSIEPPRAASSAPLPMPNTAFWNFRVLASCSKYSSSTTAALLRRRPVAYISATALALCTRAHSLQPPPASSQPHCHTTPTYRSPIHLHPAPSWGRPGSWADSRRAGRREGRV